MSEYLLCRECEDRMRVGEDYAHEITYQADYRTAPFLDRVGLWVYEQDRFRVVQAGSLDVARLVYFALSVAWRASVSTVIDNCKLSEEHEERLRRYLLNGDPLPADLACRVIFYDLPYEDRTHVASIFALPYTESDGVITFLLYGLQCDILTGVAAADSLPLCLVHGAEQLVSLAPQEHLLDKFGDWFMQQKPRGALAKRGDR